MPFDRRDGRPGTFGVTGRGATPNGVVLALLVLAMAGCPTEDPLPGLTVAAHSASYFPIDSGPHAVDCIQCHTQPETFEFNCLACHQHEPVATNLLHETTADYVYESGACYSCHARGVQRPIFDHVPGQTSCATCHDEGAAFAALPVPGFTHPERGAADCSACHLSVVDWANVADVPVGLTIDSQNDIEVSALFPRFAGTSIVSVSETIETLSMPMNHTSAALDPGVVSNCAACHNEPQTYYPGRLHSSLANLLAPQPTACIDCHATSVPTGFVGLPGLDPPRDPSTGEMRHDAVAWVNDVPTSDALVPQECGLCHQAPSQALPATWAQGTRRPAFHEPLTLAGLLQPDSCLDCHANARPTLTYDETTAPLPAGVVFNHGSPEAQTDCISCHREPAARWDNGLFHTETAPTPTTCLPCHQGERPTSTATWASPTFRNAPFDFVDNAAGITHGAGQDCVLCHVSSGTGVWGVNQNWQGGTYAHDPGTVADTTCIACHSSQRPDLVVGNAAALLEFDHVVNGSGDCIGCHQASVARGAYEAFFNPATGTLPGGDWRDGVTYPGAFPIGSQTQSFTVTETRLLRSGTNNLVTDTTSVTTTIYNQMVHTSAALPAALDSGSPTSPDGTVCWHCHTNTNGVVSSFIEGRYHDALTTFSAVPGGAVTPVAQPTDRCVDCHAAPRNIAASAPSVLQPMDHAAIFTAPVTIRGRSVSGVAGIDCSTCHTSPGTRWNDGVFHARVGAAVPADCTQCHYPTMANRVDADVVDGTTFAMHHASVAITFQNCQTCHTSALANASRTPLRATLWQGGVLHPTVSPQPSLCIECHNASEPAGRTPSTVRYALTEGATTTNATQYMLHTSNTVVSRDCVSCHAADARTSGSAWSPSTAFHAVVPGVTTCVECHGGGTPGTGNNMPAGLTTTAAVSSASSNQATGIAAGTRDQITHTDLNVARQDCNFCHTQTGPSTTAGVQGREWAQASFHTRFTGAVPLIMNGTSARCSNCHLNVRPGPGFSVDHSTFTNAAGSQDCNSCHAWPGTGSAAAPNWLGAEGGFPAFISVGGFLVPQPPAADAITIEGAIADLPHPDVSGIACTTCHTTGAGRQAIGYDHASTRINNRCAACHEAGTDLVGTVWNNATTAAAGAGDSRPFTVDVMTVTAYGRTRDVTTSNHFFPTDCYECHNAPAGIATVTTGAAYAANWSFPHTETRMTDPATCIQCHGADGLLPLDLLADPLSNLDVVTQLPTYAGTTMVSATTTTQTLPMPMDHLSSDVSATVMTSCSNCHIETTSYYPGLLHSSLANLQTAQPANCVSCHFTSMPTGFVGPPDPPRDPLTGAMKHDAVVWTNDVPTTTALVPLECNTCHVAPSQALTTTWAVGTAPAEFHINVPEPSSCIDCHANSRASGVLSGQALPAGVTFDHSAPDAQRDCTACHASGTYTDWTDGRFHVVGDATPASCLPCHQGERPTTTANWDSPTFNRSPFDFVTNAAGVTHGDGQDCVQCHASSGTGTWGINQNWQDGFFDHAPGTVADETCIACHSTQRADLVRADSTALLNGFNHATQGSGDCLGCHQATVVAGAYFALFNAAGSFPGGDWQGGVSYPGDTLISSPTQSVTLTELQLIRSGPNNLVTSMAQIQATLPNAMLHTSSALPAALNGGPANNPDATTCWHCHDNTNGVVTSFAGGVYHASLTTFRNTPGGAIVPFPQPTTGCLDCHAQMHPGNIVEKAASSLQPMDHDALFTAPVTIGGRSVSGVAAIDCGTCHRSPGGLWNDGRFHANVGAAQPLDCTICHYPTVANSQTSDLTRGTTFSMKHASSRLTIQNCKTCHTSALARGSQLPLASTQWNDGTLHPHVAPQPTGCLDCHTISKPATSTQGTVVYTLPQGGTATNGGQWMNHTNTFVTGRDCVQCHAADARTNGSAWSRNAPFHAVVGGVTQCALCHGTTNGQGTVAGTRNNLPNGLIDTSTVSTAPSDPTTGVPLGTKDQIVHTDLNVSGRDCNFCHTQVGASTTAGIAGREWAQADFHVKFTAGNALLTNGTTARCANCHLNVKPRVGYSFDHTGFTNVSGSIDCSSCHSWPGTGSPTTPNWQGAAGGFPPIIATGGFVIPRPPAATAGTIEAAIANLPHPTPAATACTACHVQPGGGKNAIGYDHASTLANGKCSSCHEAGSNLLSPVWNGATTAATAAGDTRPFTLTSVRASFKGNSLTITGGNHFFPVDCFQCHVAPPGVVTGTTGTTFTTRWRFPHTERNMTNPATCRLCHGNNIPN